ncbi:MAG: DinB family protein [Acidimicrobiales bacterium]
MTLAERVADYEAATAELLAVANVADALLDRPVDDGWTARQVLHHLADSETTSYLRLRRLLAEPGSTIQGYDQEAWAACAELGYSELGVAHALAVVAAVRAASHDVLARLSDDDLARSGTHSESGAYTLDDWLTIYTAHPREHRAQLLAATGA